MKYKELFIDKNYDCLYYYLKDHGYSESYISKLRSKQGNILVNGKICNTKSSIKEGDILSLALNIKQKSDFKKNDLPLDIVYEDDYLLIVNKPAGITTSASRSHYDENLSGAILNYMENKDSNFVLRIINRLDKDTAGLILIAKDIITYSKMNKIEKVYYAVCKGEIKKSMILDYPIETISNNGINQIRRIVSPLGKKAKTFVTPLKTINNKTLIKLTLENGRTHQIRVHLSHIEHPLIGDEIYGIKSNLINHTALICKEISFKHPFNNKDISLSVPFPPDFENLLT